MVVRMNSLTWGIFNVLYTVDKAGSLYIYNGASPMLLPLCVYSGMRSPNRTTHGDVVIRLVK